MTKAVHVLAVELFVFLSLAQISNTQDEEDLLLLAAVLGPDYKKTEAPRSGTDTAVVFVQLRVTFVGDVQDTSFDFHLQAWVSFFWRDSRLSLEPLQKLGLQIAPNFVLDRMWTPPVSFDSAKEVNVMSRDLVLRSDGFLLLHRRIAFTVHCSHGSRNFVFDARSCDFVIGSFFGDEYGVRLRWIGEDNGTLQGGHEGVVRDAGVQPLVYELTRVEYGRVDSDSVPGLRQRLVATFYFSKRPLTVLLHTYIPSAIVVFASWVSFWIEASMITSRFTLGIVCLLVLSFQATHAKIGNPVGTHVRAADVWVFMCTVMVFLSLVECAIASNLYREQETLSKRDVVDDIRYGYRLHRTPSKGCIILCDAGTQTEGSHITFGSNEIDQLARMVFPIAFFFCCCFYVLWFATSVD